MTPTLTINAGVRWDLQTPFAPVNDIMSAGADRRRLRHVRPRRRRPLRPVQLLRARPPPAASVPEFVQLTTGTQGYETDWNNFAPNVGVAWRPNVQGGFLRTLLGDPEQATLRGGYSVAYERQGMGRVHRQSTAPIRAARCSLTRDANTGLVPAGESWPVLLSQTQPAVSTRAVPRVADLPDRGPGRTAPTAQRVRARHPDRVGAHRGRSASSARSRKDMAVDIRYVGTRGVNQWSELNYNERQPRSRTASIDEFQLAMAEPAGEQRRRASRTAHGSFAYFGPGTGTSPLPIYLAYLNGSRDATNPAAYTGGTQTWTNTTLAGRLVAPESAAAQRRPAISTAS